MSDVAVAERTERLTAADFDRVLRSDISPFVAARIAERDFRYRTLDDCERSRLVDHIHRTIESGNLDTAGEHRLPVWNNGWAAHLRELGHKPVREALIPGYFGKYPIVRWHGDLIEPVSPGFEYACLEILQYWAFERFFGDADAVYEFGCGTGHNLIRIREMDPTVPLHGLDWAPSSGEIVRSLGMGWTAFDFFHPDRRVSVYDNSVFTCAALEQVGARFVPFVDYLVSQRPRIVVHIEPVEELLDPSRELDALSVAYARKRGYLSGFLTHLRSRNDIVIHESLDTGIGSLFLSGYSVVVWSPA